MATVANYAGTQAQETDWRSDRSLAYGLFRFFELEGRRRAALETM